MGELITEGWVTTDEAASLTGYSISYMRQMAQSKRIEARKVGRDWLVNLSSLLAHKAEMDRLGAEKHNPYRDDLLAQGRGRKG